LGSCGKPERFRSADGRFVPFQALRSDLLILAVS
jgi:hypothetical protein